MMDASMLVRDPSASHGLNSVAGSSSAATGPDGREVFTTLDSGSTTGAPTWVHAGTQHAEAGFQDPALGWVGVRADVSGGSVHASVVPNSTDAAQALSSQLSGLNSYLSEHHTEVETVTLAQPDGRWSPTSTDQGANQGMHQGSGQGGNQNAGQQAGQHAGPGVGPDAGPGTGSQGYATSLSSVSQSNRLATTEVASVAPPVWSDGPEGTTSSGVHISVVA
jgi:hypothetical protein